MQHPLLASLRISERGKTVSAREAVSLIRPGDTLATSGFVGIGFAETIACALEELFLAPENDPNTPSSSSCCSGKLRSSGATIALTSFQYNLY